MNLIAWKNKRYSANESYNGENCCKVLKKQKSKITFKKCTNDIFKSILIGFKKHYSYKQA